METKRVTVDFAERASVGTAGETIKVQLDEIEKNFKACNDILSGAGMNEIDYIFQPEEISKVADCIIILTTYVVSTPQHVASELDEPLTADFQSKVLPALTDIVVKDISTSGSSVETHSDVDGIGNTGDKSYIREIGFENFIDVTLSMMVEDMQSPENIRAVDIFLNLFRDEFESLEKDGVRNIDGSIYYYLDHVPWGRTFQSETLDGSSIKPLIEYITGRDMITGEKLTEYERYAQRQRAGYNIGALGVEAAIGGIFGVGAFAVVGAAAFAEVNNITGAATYSVTKKAVQELGGSDELAENVGKGAEFLSNSIGGKLIFDNIINTKVTANAAEAVVEGGNKTVKELISESDTAQKWGILDDGTNQGVKHFSDYWEKYPERIPSLEQRLGVSEGSFNNSLEGFNNFTSQAEHVVSEAISVGNVRNINGKSIYYIDGIANPKKGVVVIIRDGKIQSMMPSDFKSFSKMQ